MLKEGGRLMMAVVRELAAGAEDSMSMSNLPATTRAKRSAVPIFETLKV
jgi:hypothetical protein